MRRHFLMIPLMALLCFALVLPPSFARADAAKDFVTSCTYGVLAGTLVGAATLAFSDQPGSSLNNIARGASLGLYAGIFLGLYVINLNSDPGDDDIQQKVFSPPRLQVLPVFSFNQLSGAQFNYDVLRF